MKEKLLLLIAGVAVWLSTVVASDHQSQQRSEVSSKADGDLGVQSHTSPVLAPKSPLLSPQSLRFCGSPLPTLSSSSSDGGEHCCYHHAIGDEAVDEIIGAVVDQLEREGGLLGRIEDNAEQVTTFLDGLGDEMHGLREEFNNSAASMRPHEFRDYLTQVCVGVIKAVQNGKVGAMTPTSLERLVRRVVDAHGANKIGGMTECKFRAMLDERSSGTIGEMSGAVLKKLITDTVRDVLISQELAEKVTAERVKMVQKNQARAEQEEEATAVAKYRAAHPWKARASDCKNKVVCCCKRIPVAVQTFMAVVAAHLVMGAAGF